MDCRAGRLSGRYRVVMYKPKKTKTEMKTGLLSLCCALMLFASCGKRIPKSDAVAIVPKPVSEQLSDSTFDLTKRTRIRLLADDSTLLRSTDFFNGVVSKAFGKGLYVAQGGQAQKDAINVRLDDSLPSEGYTLLITPDSIDIAGGSPAGVFACSRPGGRTGPGDRTACGRNSGRASFRLPRCDARCLPPFLQAG